MLTVLGEMTGPSILLGDLNDHPPTSKILARANVVGMRRLTKNDPTTLSKSGTLANRWQLTIVDR